jgi:hypothetical protein
MNRDETRKAAEVMLAYADGELVEQARAYEGMSAREWHLHREMTWDWSRYEYRIKPKPREFYIDTDSMHVYSLEEFGYRSAQMDMNNCILVREVIE